MIDHIATYERYGVNPPFKVRDRLIVQCEDCLDSRSICGRVYQKIIKQDNLTLCSSCRAKRNREKFKESYNKSDKKRSESLSKTYREKWQDDNYRQRQLISLRSESSKLKHSQKSKELWEDSQYRELIIGRKKEVENTPEFKEIMRKIYDSEEYREKLRGHWLSDDYRDKVLSVWEDEEFKSEFSQLSKERMLKLWSDPKYCELMLEVAHRNSFILKEIYKKDINLKHKISKKIKEKWQDPEYREKMAIALANMPRISSQQYNLYDLLRSFGVEFHEEGLKTRVGPYVFDCLVPKQGNMKKNLLIECHGEWFHDKEDRKKRDMGKLSYINNNFPDYEVRVLWEQWFLFKNKVKDLVSKWLGISSDPIQIDFEFKDVIIRDDLSYKDSVKFLSEYHYLYTCPRGSKYFGVYFGDKLIAVCLFSPLIRQNISGSINSGLKHSDVLEISRFCIHPQYQKKNFASWFISKCLKRINCKAVVAYSDDTAGHVGTIYKASGFFQDKVVKSDYWYVDDNGWVMHKRTLYSRACKMHMKESEYAFKHNYRKVFGGVKYRYVRFFG